MEKQWSECVARGKKLFTANVNGEFTKLSDEQRARLADFDDPRFVENGLEYVTKDQLHEYGLDGEHLQAVLKYGQRDPKTGSHTWGKFITENFPRPQGGSILVDDVSRYDSSYAIKAGDSKATIEKKKAHWCPIPLSRILWLGWDEACTRFGARNTGVNTNASSLERIIHIGVTNKVTGDVCKRATRRLFLDEDPGFKFQQGQGKGMPSVSFFPDDESFFAILGTPNCQSAAYLCLENAEALGNKVPVKITAWWREAEAWFDLEVHLGTAEEHQQEWEDRRRERDAAGPAVDADTDQDDDVDMTDADEEGDVDDPADDNGDHNVAGRVSEHPGPAADEAGPASDSDSDSDTDVSALLERYHGELRGS